MILVKFLALYCLRNYINKVGESLRLEPWSSPNLTIGILGYIFQGVKINIPPLNEVYRININYPTFR